ncbi:MAG: hypothetical protein GYB53_18650 [Rhodobacteraceae bacterium]|nr:hypothetical protein [Paracoccaceae bacterium]MBR9819887.1 hypothetical protein [Paracoccaceae bacterium]
MTQTIQDFDDRLRRIEGNRPDRPRGQVMRFEVDDYGNVRRRRPAARRAPLWRLLRPLCFVALALYLFKVVAFATLGESEFQLRSEALAEGSALERQIAVLMQPDPLTERLAAALHPLLRTL